MFKNVIRETAFTTPEANDFFANSIPLSRDPSNEDVTLTSTLRALVYPRMKDSGVEKFNALQVGYRSNEVYGHSSDLIDCFLGNALLIYNCTGDENERKNAIENCVSRFENDETNQFVEIKKIHDFYKDAFYVRCIVNDEKKIAILYIINCDTRKLHYVQCSLPAVLRWFFDPEKGLSDDEMKLIRSFMNSSSEEYMSILDKMIEEYNLEEGRIHSILHGFETIRIDKQIASIKQNIEASEYSIKRYSEAIHSESLNLEDLNYRLAGYMNAKLDDTGETTELEEYFLCNKSVNLENGDESGMVFVATGYLTYFDDDQAYAMIRNNKGIIESAIAGINTSRLKISSGNIRKLMKKIFVDREYKLRICGAYQFSSNSGVTGLSGYSYPAKFRTYMPNPHLDRYSCLGDNRAAIERHLREGDYVYGVEQCVSSCISLNLVDTSVMIEFVKRICSDRAEDKFIELPNGEIVSPVEACVLINKEE